jgi:hypothetical protein
MRGAYGGIVYEVNAAPSAALLTPTRSELVGHLGTTSEVHLVGRLAFEGAVRHRLVVRRALPQGDFFLGSAGEGVAF